MAVEAERFVIYKRQRVRDVVGMQIRIFDEGAGCHESDVGFVDAAELRDVNIEGRARPKPDISYNKADCQN